MGLDDRTVDKKQAVLVLAGQRIKERLSYIAPCPKGVAIIDSRAWATAFRKIAPRRTGAQNIKNTVKNPAVVNLFGPR